MDKDLMHLKFLWIFLAFTNGLPKHSHRKSPGAQDIIGNGLQNRDTSQMSMSEPTNLRDASNAFTPLSDDASDNRYAIMMDNNGIQTLPEIKTEGSSYTPSQTEDSLENQSPNVPASKRHKTKTIGMDKKESRKPILETGERKVFTRNTYNKRKTSKLHRRYGRRHKMRKRKFQKEAQIRRKVPEGHHMTKQLTHGNGDANSIHNKVFHRRKDSTIKHKHNRIREERRKRPSFDATVQNRRVLQRTHQSWKKEHFTKEANNLSNSKLPKKIRKSGRKPVPKIQVTSHSKTSIYRKVHGTKSKGSLSKNDLSRFKKNKKVNSTEDKVVHLRHRPTEALLPTHKKRVSVDAITKKGPPGRHYIVRKRGKGDKNVKEDKSKTTVIRNSNQDKVGRRGPHSGGLNLQHTQKVTSKNAKNDIRTSVRETLTRQAANRNADAKTLSNFHIIDHKEEVTDGTEILKKNESLEEKRGKVQQEETGKDSLINNAKKEKVANERTVKGGKTKSHNMEVQTMEKQIPKERKTTNKEFKEQMTKEEKITGQGIKQENLGDQEVIKHGVKKNEEEKNVNEGTVKSNMIEEDKSKKERVTEKEMTEENNMKANLEESHEKGKILNGHKKAVITSKGEIREDREGDNGISLSSTKQGIIGQSEQYARFPKDKTTTSENVHGKSSLLSQGTTPDVKLPFGKEEQHGKDTSTVPRMDKDFINHSVNTDASPNNQLIKERKVVKTSNNIAAQRPPQNTKVKSKSSFKGNTDEQVKENIESEKVHRLRHFNMASKVITKNSDDLRSKSENMNNNGKEEEKNTRRLTEFDNHEKGPQKGNQEDTHIVFDGPYQKKSQLDIVRNLYMR